MSANPRLSVELAGLTLSTPVAAASGTFGYGQEFESVSDLAQLGAIVTKGISLEPRAGNPPPRTCETPAGMLNAIGLENVGLDSFLASKLPFLEEAPAACVVNVFGESVEEYAELAGRLDGAPGVDALEANISCPNVKAGGIFFGVEPAAAAEVCAAMRARTRLPLIVKLSPGAGAALVPVARAVVGAGADALSLINTIPGMAIDIEARRPVLANVYGGLSGPAIRPVAVRMVREVSQALPDVPVIGIGGIASGRDAIEFMLAGAAAVQVGTALFVEPDLPARINRELLEYLDRHGFASIRDVVGALEAPGGESRCES